MYKRLKIIMIIIWSFIAIFLTSLLVYGIRTGKGAGDFFIDFKGNGISTKLQKEESVYIEDCDKIYLDLSSEDVVISSTEEDKLKVIESSSGTLEEKEKFTLTKEGNTISIRKGNPNTVFNIFSFGHINRKIEVFIPKGYGKDLEVKLSSGNINISNDITLRDVIMSQSSGNFNSRSSITANSISLRASSGNIKANNLLVKAYELDTTSGNIDIAALSGSGQIEVTSGNIAVGYKEIDESSKVKASSGNISLTVPQGLSFEFQGKCTSGDINSSFDLSYKNKRGNDATVKVGNGPYKKLSAQTTSGNIKLSEK